MKIRICVALLSMLLAVSLVAGCEFQPAPTETQAPRQIFQVDMSADTPELAGVILDEQVPLGEAPSEGNRLTGAEAIVIALEKAGLLQEQVAGLKAELDLDDGPAHYEVEFSADGWE